jgi:hypothetical protein
LVTTIDKKGVNEIDRLKLMYVPAVVYAYTVGVNTLIQKQKRNK